ncbi:MAG: hypothetical protein V1778_05450 [bacterium]
MRTVGSILLLLILVPTTVVVFLVLSLQFNILTAKFIERELADHQAYAIVEDQIAQQIAKLEINDLPIEASDIQILAKRVLPGSWFQQSVEGVLDHTYAWFNGSPEMVLSLPVDLRGPKAELTPALDVLIESAIPRMPECSRQSSPDTLCRTENMTVAQVKDVLKSGGVDLTSAIAQLPDTLDLANPVLPSLQLGTNDQASTQASSSQRDQSVTDARAKSQDEQQKKDEQQKQEAQTSTNPPEQKQTFNQQMKGVVDQLTNAKQQYHRGLQYWMDALMTYGVLILLYLVINIKGWRRFTRWSGVLLLVIGILPLLISIASGIALEQVILPGLHVEGNLPKEVQAAIPASIRDVQHALFFPILVLSAALVVLGIGAIIGTHFIPQPQGKKPLKPNKA